MDTEHLTDLTLQRHLDSSNRHLADLEAQYDTWTPLPAIGLVKTAAGVALLAYLGWVIAISFVLDGLLDQHVPTIVMVGGIPVAVAAGAGIAWWRRSTRQRFNTMATRNRAQILAKAQGR